MSICGNEESFSKEKKKKRPRGFEEETDFTNVVLQIDDSNIWSNLPENILLDEILARVPPFSIFRFRSVCKRWNSILQDLKFLNRHSTSSHMPCLLTLLFKKGKPECFFYVFDYATEYKITFEFLNLSWNYFWLVGSSSGLVCFAGFFDHGGLTTLVCNPLTKKSRLLPRMKNDKQKRRQLIFVADRLKRSYKVIAHGDESLPTEVYDSRTNQWTLHHDTMFKPDSLKLAVCFCDDSWLYTNSLTSPSGLRMYRIDTREWETLTFDEIPASLSNSYLVSGLRKRLFLVTRVFDCVKIWEFDYKEEVFCWVEICKMPEEYLKELLGDVSVRSFECFGQDDFVCFRSRSQGKALLFDVDNKIWSWVIGFGRALRSSSNHQFSFYEPRFDAFV